jgi:hypothetical protein
MRSPRNSRFFRAMAWALPLAGSPLALAQSPALPDAKPAPQVTRPAAAGRLVRVFDFEERLTNPGEVPRDWLRNQDNPAFAVLREGFPSWNKAKLSFIAEGGIAHRGEGSVQLPTAGGSTALMLAPGVIPVFADTDYRISAHLRTDGLVLARAAMIARLLDGAGKPIPGALAATPLTTSNAAWREVSVDVSTTTAAAFIQVELLLLQPRQQASLGHWTAVDGLSPAGTTVFREDLRGSATFDDVSVLQLPRVRMTTGALAGVIPAERTPTVRIQVRDLANEPLTMHAEVLDSQGAIVDATSATLGVGAAVQQWQPRLALSGWYRARMQLTNAEGVRVGGAATDFAWLAPLASHRPQSSREDDPQAIAEASARALSFDGTRLGIALSSLPDPVLEQAPALLQSTGLASITLPVWAEASTPRDMPARVDRLQLPLRGLIAGYADVTLALGPVPTELARATNLDSDDAWGVLSGDDKPWLPFASEALEKLGGRMAQWQVGLASEDRAFWRSPSLPRDISARLTRRVPGLVLGVPCDFRQRWSVATLPTRSRLVVRLDRATTPQSIRAALPDWQDLLASASPTQGATFVLDGRDDPTLSPAQSAARLVQQGVELWRLLGDDPARTRNASLQLMDPWRWTTTPDAARPSAHLPAWAALAERLRQRRIVAKFPHAEGVTCYILAPATQHATGALVAWNESAAPADAVLEVPVSPGTPVRAIDAFGNAVRVQPIASGGAGLARIARVQLTSAPVFIEGIDVGLAQFLADLEIAPRLLDASVDVGEHEIVLRNPWSQGVSGKVSILEPGGFSAGPKDRTWRITPRSMSFALAPGEERRLPISVAFQASEESGEKEFVLAVELAAEQNYGLVEVRRTMELGLKSYKIDLVSARVVAQDVVIEGVVSNTSDQVLNLELTALAPGQPRSRITVTNLAPGQQAVRRFLYEGVAGALAGQRVLLSVVDPEARTRLNKSAQVGAPE